MLKQVKIGIVGRTESSDDVYFQFQSDLKSMNPDFSNPILTCVSMIKGHLANFGAFKPCADRKRIKTVHKVPH